MPGDAPRSMRMATSPATSDSSAQPVMMVSKASGVAKRSTTTAVSALSTAPSAMDRAPLNPAAVPASAGRTDMVPALAAGSVRPLPRPTKTVSPKSASGCDTPAANTAKASAIAVTVTTRPDASSTPTPRRRAWRALMAAPTRKPLVIDPTPMPTSAGDRPQAAAPT